MTAEIHSQISRCQVNPTYRTSAQDITGPRNLYLGLQNTQLPLICGPLDVCWLSFFLDRLVCAFYFHLNLFECWCQISTALDNFLGWSSWTFFQNGMILIFCLYISMSCLNFTEWIRLHSHVFLLLIHDESGVSSLTPIILDIL